jgi:hypothetical protein
MKNNRATGYDGIPAGDGRCWLPEMKELKFY